MSTPKEFKWGRDGSPPELNAHSEAKLRVFRDYLGRYLDVLTQPRSRRELKLTIVDGFAGGGYFTYHGKEVSGSPLMILEELEAAQRRINEGRPNPVVFSVRTYFVEKNRNNFAALKSRLWARGYGPRIGVDIDLRHGLIQAEIDQICADIRRLSPRSGRAIFLFDQTGYTDIELSMARRILGEFDRSEIIMTWAVDRLIDFLNSRSEFAKAVLGVGIDKGLLREILAMKGQKHVRHLIQNRLAQHLKKQLGDPYFTVFFVKPSESHRALWLVHASKHPTARDAMLRTHWAVANASISHGPDGLGTLGFTPYDELSMPLPLEFDPAVLQRVKAGLKQDLVPMILNSFGHKPVSLRQLRMIALNGGVMGTFDHFGEAVLSSAEDRELQILTSAGRPKRLGAKLKTEDRILIPETPPLLALMGLDLPKK